MKKRTLFILTYLIFFVGSFLFFYSTGALEREKIQKKLAEKPVAGEDVVDETEPKTEECPLNGAYHSKTLRAQWEKRRPLGVMIENSLDARPQSGLSRADIIFEAVAEGGVTRFLTIFYCQGTSIVGPVRSARVYFLDMIGGFGEYPLYAHVGGANTPGPANALGQIQTMGWGIYNDINQFSVGFPVFKRDPERLPNVATEHTMYSNTFRLWDTAAKRDLTNVDEDGVSWDKEFTKWTFKDDAALNKRSDKQTISFGFWEDYHSFDVTWKYDKTKNTYMRTNGKKIHRDKNTGAQLAAKTVIVALMDESVADDGYDQGQHLLYGTTGEGEAFVFQDGETIEATWKKEDRFSPIVFFDENDDEIALNRGLIWVEMIPTGNKVSY